MKSNPCVHCTVPVESGTVCKFCVDYVPPSTRHLGMALEEALQHVRYVAEDIDDAFEVAPDDLTISVALDLVNAEAHVLAAQRLIDQAVAILAADAQAVE